MSYTLYPNSEAESTIDQIVNDLNEFISIENHGYVLSCLMIGGYGKREGGVTIEGDRVLVKNNIDLMLIHENHINIRFLDLFSNKVKSLESLHDVSIDISRFTEKAFLASKNSLMMYDLKKGHVPIYTKDPENLQYLLDSIPKFVSCETEMFRLAVNRGLLLLINKFSFDKGEVFLRKAKVHISKAIIGLGDYILFYKGLYHWSYIEKSKRINLLPSEYKEIARLYRLACSYRLHDNNDLFEGEDLSQLNSYALTLFASHVVAPQSNYSLKFFLDNLSRRVLIVFHLARMKQVKSLFESAESIVDRSIVHLFSNAKNITFDFLKIWAKLRDPSFFKHYGRR